MNALSSSGLDESLFNGHRFWIGGATTAGVPETSIKILGRGWQSPAYQGYIRPTPAELAYVSQALAKVDAANSVPLLGIKS